MSKLAETLTSYELIVEATGLPWKAYECGPWINNDKGKLNHNDRLPKNKGIYIHYFSIGGKWVPFYAGMTRAKDGLYGRIFCEYNKKQAGPAKSGPYETCLYLEYEGWSGLPIGILFHDMSEKTDHEIEQAEKDLLNMADFCSNKQGNGSRRLDDLLRAIVELNKTATPYLNTIECMETVTEDEVEDDAEELPKVVVNVEVKKIVPVVNDTPSADLCRDMIHSYADILHPDLFRKIQKEEQDEYHRRLYQRYKELLSDRENQRILEEEVRG